MKNSILIIIVTVESLVPTRLEGLADNRAYINCLFEFLLFPQTSFTPYGEQDMNPADTGQFVEGERCGRIITLMQSKK